MGYDNSRRKFLKKLGAGTIGLGALSLPYASALDVKSPQGLQIFSSDTEYLNVDSNAVDVKNTKLDLNSQKIDNIANITNSSNVIGSSELNAGNVDVTSFDGSSGSSGQFLQTDGTSLSFASVSGGMTDSEKQVFNDLIANQARLQFEHNISELSYDGGLFDIYRDQSKIAGSSNVTISTLDGGDSDGKVELKSGSNDSVSSNSGDGSAPDTIYVEVNSFGYIDVIGFEQWDSSFNVTSLDIKDSNGNTLASKSVSGSASSWTTVYLSQSDYSRLIDNEIIKVSFDNPIEGGSYSTTSSDVLNVAYFDGSENAEWSATQNSGGGTAASFTGVQAKNGSINSVSKDLSKSENGGFSSAPTSAVVSQKATIPTNNEDITYTLRDGNGNTKTVNQSDIDEEVDVSSFTSTTVEVDVNLSGDGSDTPTSDDYMVHFKE